ncbi:hypothetical protein V3C41_08955 [Paenarthrobacter nicotinovorans]|uniref:DUF3093 family protein n=1 Tax=Paenarthrobacter nicotinovorans TaxID=29320 RepID=A0ABV0GRQ3_PAENI
MKDPEQPLSTKGTVSVVHWESRTGDEPVVKFVIFGVLGVLIGLLLMVFLPAFRSIGAVAVFSVVFAGILTLPVMAARRNFMRGVTVRVNDTIAEVTGNASEALSVKQLHHLARTGEPWPLLVSGVAGLRLQVQRVLAQDEDAPAKWRAVITAVPPRSGVSSFDRLLDAALKPAAGNRR